MSLSQNHRPELAEAITKALKLVDRITLFVDEVSNMCVATGKNINDNQRKFIYELTLKRVHEHGKDMEPFSWFDGPDCVATRMSLLAMPIPKLNQGPETKQSQLKANALDSWPVQIQASNF